ncbi:MAG: translation initiation factor IF-2 [Verrucomicrobiota bacterium]|jgi:translation initiation factor IF-2|nr:translation initiation factor IF-2 [Verrucomicrobiota bacterium]
MPVRIYEIAKNLGVQSKDVLAKAKELNISNAKVASSSLDKITAEYLEEQLSKDLKPEVAEANDSTDVVDEKPAVEPVPSGPVLIVSNKEEETEEHSSEEDESPLEEATPETPTDEQQDDKPESTETAQDSGPKVGQQVGFVNLGNLAPRREQRRHEKKDKRQNPNPTTERSAESPPKPAVPQYTTKKDAPTITLKPPIMVRELAEAINRKPFQLIADLMQLGVFANVNQAIDEPTAKQLCAKHGFKFEAKKRQRDATAPAPVQEKTLELDTDDEEKDLKPRPPVVAVMGHVDHGKTTLLDAIRKADVVSGEAGGITQHIGAYSIDVPHPEDKKRLEPITFLDTPGHAAFSAMRARGANVTDMIVLVVAANDGVMPQTIESVSHAKESGATIIVAVNKCDLPAANTQRPREQLAEHGLSAEDWGGDTLFVDISAVKGEGIDKLLDAILLQAELLELKANPDRRAMGNVIESGMEQGGPTATVLVRKGTLNLGDIVICGQYFGKARALINEEGQRMKTAGPSFAVKLLGLNGVPEAGDEFNSVDNEKAARDLAENRGTEAHKEKLEGRAAGVTLENLFDQIDATAAKVLKVIVKADTQGSVEAIVESLSKIESEKVSLEVIHHAVGTVTESDVHLAAGSQAVILGFHTRVDKTAPDAAKQHGVQIKQYKIIYELIDEIKDAMAGLLDPIEKTVVIGTAEVRQLFPLSKGGNVAGCMVTDGHIKRGNVRVMRGDKEIFTGPIHTLRRFKDNVDVVRSGMDCGIRVDGYDEYEEGDLIQAVTTEQVAATL